METAQNAMKPPFSKLFRRPFGRLFFTKLILTMYVIFDHLSNSITLDPEFLARMGWHRQEPLKFTFDPVDTQTSDDLICGLMEFLECTFERETGNSYEELGLSFRLLLVVFEIESAGNGTFG